MQFELVPERLRGEIARFDICWKDDPRHRAEGQAHHGQAHPRGCRAGVKKWAVRAEFVVGRVLSHDVVDKNTGELVARANDEITEELLTQAGCCRY